MPRPCSICKHPRRAEIDAALATGSESLRRIAARFDASDPSLRRHQPHIAKTIAKAEAKAERIEIQQGSKLSQRLADLAADAKRIQGKAEEAGELDTALKAIGQLVKMVELLGKADGELGDGGTTVNVAVVQSAEWENLRARIVAALAPFPEAKAAVIEAIRE